MSKYTFFDLDGTLCESKQNIEMEMLRELNRLNEKSKVFIVSGAELSRMLVQAPLKWVTYFSQNGNLIYDGDRIIRQNDLTNKAEILDHIKLLADKMGIEITDDMIDDRGSQISFSFVGHNAPLEEKKKFDLDRKIRGGLLQGYPFPGAVIGGTTCIDYIPKTKGENIKHYLDLRKIKPSDCLYIGDAFMNFGNDATVLGVIPVHQVTSPLETLNFIKTL